MVFDMAPLYISVLELREVLLVLQTLQDSLPRGVIAIQKDNMSVVWYSS